MRRRRWLARADLILLITLLFLVSLITGIVLRRNRPSTNRLHLFAAFLNVGQGDCTLLRSDDGEAVLVDTGSAGAAPLVVKTLQRQGVHSLALLVLAAPDADQIGGTEVLLSSGIPIHQVWLGADFGSSQALQTILQALGNRHIPVHLAAQGDSFNWDKMTLTALWPPKETMSANQAALICRVASTSTSALLAGPAAAAEIDPLVSGVGEGLDCDILQIAGGGTAGAAPLELLRRATPSIAVISCSKLVPPSPNTLRHLEAAGADVWRTDIQGAVSVFTDNRSAPVVTAARM